MGEIGIIINKNAKRNKKDPGVVDRVKDIVGRHGIVEVTEKIEDISESVKRFIAERVKVIGISGGDGTFHQTITHIINTYRDRALPYLIHLKQGTMNTIARGFHIRQRQDEILHRIRSYIEGKLISTPKVVERPTICVEERYGFVFGTGLPANFLQLYYQGKLRGPLKALYMIIRGVISHIMGTGYAKKITQPVECRIEVDGQRVSEGPHTGVLVSTVASMGLGMKVAYRVEQYRDRFQVLAASVSPLKLVSRIPRFLLGLPPALEGIVDELGTHLHLNSRKPVVYTIDGDMYTSEGTLDVTIGPVVKSLTV